MVYFKDNYTFPRFQRGSNFFQGGGGEGRVSKFFQGVGGGGGSNFFRGRQLLIPYRNHIICDFPGGGPDPLSPPPLRIQT